MIVLTAMETHPHVTVMKFASSTMIVVAILDRYVQLSHLLIQHKVYAIAIVVQIRNFLLFFIKIVFELVAARILKT